MGAGSSAEPSAPPQEDGAAAAPPEPAKALDASSPVPDINEDSLEIEVPPQEPQQPGAVTAPQELTGQQPEVTSPVQEPPGQHAEALITSVEQTEPSSITLKEDDAQTMEISPSDSSTKDGVAAGKEDAHTDKRLPSVEEDAEDGEHASEPQSYDLGFKKVFKFVGFRFTVKKEKTGKSEPVQLLTVKKETQVTEGADDQKEVSSEETVMPEDAPSAEDSTKDALKNEKAEDESPKTPEANEICSQSSASATDTASPLRKFFSQGWTGFRKKKSFRKPREDEQQSPTKEEQEKEGATSMTEISEKEKSESERQVEEKHVTAVTIETQEKEQTEDEKQESKTATTVGFDANEKEEVTEHDEQDVAAAVATAGAKEGKAEDQESKSVEVSEDLGEKEEKNEEGEKESEVTEKPLTTKSVMSVITTGVNGELKASSEVLPVGKDPESMEKCEINDRTEVSSEEKLGAGSLLATESSSEDLKKSEGIDGSKPVLLDKETFDEKTETAELEISPATEAVTEKLETQGEAQDGATEKKSSKEDEAKLALDAAGPKSFSTSEQSVDTEDDQQSVKPTDEGLQGKIVEEKHDTDGIKPGEITAETTPEEASGKRPPEGITNEAELLSSQEKTKLQGSPLKKLFTGTGLKKLSGKKHKGKREESKLGEQGELTQHLSDSPDSPEEQKAESSASSPEELNEIPSLEKSVDGTQVSENEDAAVSDVERKRESVTPWASFKKMVTPKKRVRRPSESDKEEEVDKTKSIATSVSENTAEESQVDLKENGIDQKPEKVTEEPKRKVDTSVSWEAFICVGSSKKRARKSSSSDEESEHKLGQESQKIEDSGQSKETATDAILTSSQESDQGQGNSSPEQAGSPSEGEGISTWESFKRLVTPRRKSKTRMEERTEDSVAGSSLEHSTSDGEPGKDESWVPFRKLMPGRRKKKSDGKPEATHLKQAREDMAETAEEDSDIPAVVPLSEYEAAEQEKIEAQQVKDTEALKERSSEEERVEKPEDSKSVKQASEELVHAVTVSVVEGERAVTSIEERSPSWISAALTECIEQEEEEEKETEKVIESEVVVEEAMVVAKTIPEMRKDVSDDTTASELELTSEAVTALEETAEASCAEETMEVSFAEETTEMVSAVSQLIETPDTTEEVTPVQEVEATEQNLKELDKQTQKVLHEVAERVKSSDVAQLDSERTVTATVISTMQETELEVKDDAKDEKVVGQGSILLEQSLKKGEQLEDDVQPPEGTGSVQGENGIEERVHEASERSEMSAAVKESAEGYENVDVLRDEGQQQTCEEAVVEDREEVAEVQRTTEEPSSQDSEAVTPKEEQLAKQKLSEQENLPQTDLTEDERRDGCIPEVQAAVQNEIEDETSALGSTGEEPAELEGEGETLPIGPVGAKAIVAEVPVSPESQDEIPELDLQEQTCIETVPSEAPAQREEDDAVLLGVKSTEVIAAEVLMHNEVEASALTSETTGSEAAEAAEQSVRDGHGRQITAKDPVPVLEPECIEKTTETLSQSDEIKGGRIEDSMLKTETHSLSDNALTEHPPKTEEDESTLASACLDVAENGSTICTDISPKTSKTLSSLAEERTAETKQELAEISNSQDFQKEENINGQLMETVEEFQSGKQEAVRDDECCSTAVQQEVFSVQEEGRDSASPPAESSEALEVPVPVAAAAAEEHVVAEAATPTGTTAKTVDPLATTPEQMASDEVPASTPDYSGCETAEPGIVETPQPQVTHAYVNGISEKQESFRSVDQPKQNAAPLSDGLTLSHAESETDVVPTGTVESQSTKIVLNVIQTAVNRLTETEEIAALESEQHTKSRGKSPSDVTLPELLESTQVVKEEEVSSKEQELQQSRLNKHATLTESADIHAAVEKAKDMLLTSEVLEDGPSQNSDFVTAPEDISRESVRVQNSTLELSTSEDSTKDILDICQAKLKEKEIGKVVEISDQHIGRQTCGEREEDGHPPVEDGKTQTWQDDGCQEDTDCDGPQSQNSLAPEALNMC